MMRRRGAGGASSPGTPWRALTESGHDEPVAFLDVILPRSDSLDRHLILNPTCGGHKRQGEARAIMESKTVNRQIRAVIWPPLKELGFSAFTSRTAWRYRARKIDVVNFQSFNSYLANSLGCTTYSFGLNLGCYFTDVPNQFPPGTIKEVDGRLLPPEYVCHLRRALEKNIRQAELKRRDIWYVDAEGKHLPIVIQDALQAIQNSMSWFDRFESTDAALQVLLHAKEDLYDTFGFGALGSPIRNFLIGHLALAIDDQQLARKHLQAALDSGLFSNNSESMTAALQRLDKGNGDP